MVGAIVDGASNHRWGQSGTAIVNGRSNCRRRQQSLTSGVIVDGSGNCRWWEQSSMGQQSSMGGVIVGGSNRRWGQQSSMEQVIIDGASNHR